MANLYILQKQTTCFSQIFTVNVGSQENTKGWSLLRAILFILICFPFSELSSFSNESTINFNFSTINLPSGPDALQECLILWAPDTQVLKIISTLYQRKMSSVQGRVKWEDKYVSFLLAWLGCHLWVKILFFPGWSEGRCAHKCVVCLIN